MIPTSFAPDPSGAVSSPADQHELVRRGGARLPEKPQHLAPFLDRMRGKTTGDDRSHRMQVEFQRRGDAEVAAAAANRPEEIGVLAGAGAAHAAVGHHHLGRSQVVEREPVLRHQPADAAAKRQAGDARARHDAAGGRESVQLRLAVQLFPQHAALRTHRTSGGIDMDALHGREVDHQAGVDRGLPGDVVAAAAHGDLQVQRARQLHGVGHVRRAAAARDQRRPLVHESVVDASRLVEAGVGGLKESPGEGRGELLERSGQRHSTSVTKRPIL